MASPDLSALEHRAADPRASPQGSAGQPPRAPGARLGRGLGGGLAGRCPGSAGWRGSRPRLLSFLPEHLILNAFLVCLCRVGPWPGEGGEEKREVKRTSLLESSRLIKHRCSAVRGTFIVPF